MIILHIDLKFWGIFLKTIEAFAEFKSRGTWFWVVVDIVFIIFT